MAFTTGNKILGPLIIEKNPQDDLYINQTGLVLGNIHSNSRTTAYLGSAINSDTSYATLFLCAGAGDVISSGGSYDLLLQFNSRTFYMPLFTGLQSLIPLGAFATATKSTIVSNTAVNTLRLCYGSDTATLSLVYYDLTRTAAYAVTLNQVT